MHRQRQTTECCWSSWFKAHIDALLSEACCCSVVTKHSHACLLAPNTMHLPEFSVMYTYTFHQAQQTQCIHGWTCISDPNIKDMRTKAVMVVLTNLCQQSNLAVTVHWHRINLVCEMCAMSAQAWASSNILPTKIQNLSVLNLHSFAMIVWLQRKTSTDWSLAAFVSSWSHANH